MLNWKNSTIFPHRLVERKLLINYQQYYFINKRYLYRSSNLNEKILSTIHRQFSSSSEKSYHIKSITTPTLTSSQYYPLANQSNLQHPFQLVRNDKKEQKWQTKNPESRSIIIKSSLFILVHVVAIASGFYAFQVFTEIQQADEDFLNGETLNETLDNILKVIRVSNTCFLIANGSDFPLAVRIEPHFPEDRVLQLPTEQIFPGIKNNALTDAIAGKFSDFSLPLNFIHYSLKKLSEGSKAFNKDRKTSLLYYDNERKISVILSGIGAIVTSNEARRHYWRSIWGSNLNNYDSEDYILIKFVPQSARLYKDSVMIKSIKRVVSDEIIKWEVETPLDSNAK